MPTIEIEDVSRSGRRALARWRWVAAITGFNAFCWYALARSMTASPGHGSSPGGPLSLSDLVELIGFLAVFAVPTFFTVLLAPKRPGVAGCLQALVPTVMLLGLAAAHRWRCDLTGVLGCLICVTPTSLVLGVLPALWLRRRRERHLVAPPRTALPPLHGSASPRVWPPPPGSGR